jgi:hypothetical protein
VDEAVAYLERDLDELCEVYLAGLADTQDGLGSYVTRGWVASDMRGDGVGSSNPMFSIKGGECPGDVGYYCARCDGDFWVYSGTKAPKHMGGGHP